MECLFGITGAGFTLLAADTISARSIVVMKGTEDKSRQLNAHTVMLYTGEPGDTVNFAEYIQRNIKLYGIRNGIELSPKATATFTRRELADSLRSRVIYQIPRMRKSKIAVLIRSLFYLISTHIPSI